MESAKLPANSSCCSICITRSGPCLRFTSEENEACGLPVASCHTASSLMEAQKHCATKSIPFIITHTFLPNLSGMRYKIPVIVDYLRHL